MYLFLQLEYYSKINKLHDEVKENVWNISLNKPELPRLPSQSVGEIVLKSLSFTFETQSKIIEDSKIKFEDIDIEDIDIEDIDIKDIDIDLIDPLEF